MTQRIEWIDRDRNRYYMIISYYNTLVQEATAKTECVKWKHGQYFFKKTRIKISERKTTASDVKNTVGTSLIVQWLGLCTPSAGAWSGNQIPHAATESLQAATRRSRVPQLRPSAAKQNQKAQTSSDKNKCHGDVTFRIQNTGNIIITLNDDRW